MQYLNTYLNTIRNRGNHSLADSIQITADEVGKKYIETFSFLDHETGLLFGNVQSGKTGQMFGILCKAADLGFPVFLILTTDNIVLQEQTLSRVKEDLKDFCICGENDAMLFSENDLVQPAIIVLKKNARILRLWANIINNTGFMKGNPLFIIDDEADAASLNTMVNRDKQSSINKYLDSIKNGASSSIYLQVTGTPQAIFLQSQESGWHPLFTHYFAPGKGYLGGEFFFPSEGRGACVEDLDHVLDGERRAVIRHFFVTALIFAAGGIVSNCLFHPGVRQAVHEKTAIQVQKEIQWCKENEEEFFTEVENEYTRTNPIKFSKVSLDVIKKQIRNILNQDNYSILILNGKYDVSSNQYSEGCNFIVGGNTLGRGVTFPCLHTIYYTRTSKKPQADTMWQHSRMFGYDRDPGLMKVFIDSRLYKLFADINASNNSMIAQAERGLQNIKVYYPEGINPTRKNVLDNKKVSIIPGGTNFYPADPDNKDKMLLTDMLNVFDDKEPYYQISLMLMQKILEQIIPSPDFNLAAFQSVLNSFLAEKPSSQGILIIRRGRDVSQGTGALLSPNDWKLGGQFISKPVLTMYQVIGTKGWKQKDLWVPNIKLPDDIVYYDVHGINDGV